MPGGTFDFLGYTIGRFYGQAGKPYVGTPPPKKTVLRLLKEIHEQTSRSPYHVQMVKDMVQSFYDNGWIVEREVPALYCKETGHYLWTLAIWNGWKGKANLAEDGKSIPFYYLTVPCR